MFDAHYQANIDQLRAQLATALARIARLEAALADIRVFTVDTLDNLVDRAAIGNLMAIRDLCNRSALEKES